MGCDASIVKGSSVSPSFLDLPPLRSWGMPAWTGIRLNSTLVDARASATTLCTHWLMPVLAYPRYPPPASQVSAPNESHVPRHRRRVRLRRTTPDVHRLARKRRDPDRLRRNRP